MLFVLMLPNKEQLREESDEWCLYMFIAAIVNFLTGFLQKFLFGIVGENITLSVRSALYQSILKKNLGWFDLKENSASVLTSVLASDVQVLNGASTEGVAVIIESLFAVVCGIVIGFSYSWKVSLVALGCVPFMILGGYINAKFQGGMSEIEESSYKDANLIAGDAISNYRTVASFAHDEVIVNQYDRYLEPSSKKEIKKAHLIGMAYGFSQFV